MTNLKQSESDTKKNPSAMANLIYKFGKNILSDGDLKKAALLLESSTHSTCNVVSQMMLLTLWSHFGLGPMHG
jgi:outer membrane protein assembly factor BamD (BamD/ComL family)